jgi:hypothetical protein
MRSVAYQRRGTGGVLLLGVRSGPDLAPVHRQACQVLAVWRRGLFQAAAVGSDVRHFRDILERSLGTTRHGGRSSSSRHALKWLRHELSL